MLSKMSEYIIELDFSILPNFPNLGQDRTDTYTEYRHISNINRIALQLNIIF